VIQVVDDVGPAVVHISRLEKDLGVPLQEIARGPTFAIVKKP